MARVNIAGYEVSANPKAPNSLFENGSPGSGVTYLTAVTITETEEEYIFTVTDNDGDDTEIGRIDKVSGENGVTFTPHVTQTENGISISWTNDGGLENPETVTVSNGAQGPQGVQGPQGIQGPAGEGIPAGGTAGQVLTKATAADYDTEWTTPRTGTSAFDIEETSDISQANFCGADITIGTAPQGGAAIEVSNGYRFTFATGTPVYSQTTSEDPATLTVNLLNEAIPAGGTRRRFTSDTLWKNGGKCFAFDLSGRITAFKPGSSASAQGAYTRENGNLKYLVGMMTGGYITGGLVTGSNGWFLTWGEGTADISAFNITVSNIKYYKVTEITE